MGRQRNNPQMKGKEEVSETMLNGKEASQLSDSEFKELVIRKLNELTQNYRKLHGNYNELTTIQNLWDTAKAVLRGKFIAIEAYLKRIETSQINNLTLHLQ